MFSILVKHASGPQLPTPGFCFIDAKSAVPQRNNELDFESGQHADAVTHE